MVKEVTQETLKDFAKAVLNDLGDKNILLLSGELGSGKTSFVKAVAYELGIKESITSPTFLIMKEYEIEKNTSYSKLFHIDAYRTESGNDLTELDLESIWSDGNNLVCIEWPERIKDLIPLERSYSILFEHVNRDVRKLTITE